MSSQNILGIVSFWRGCFTKHPQGSFLWRWFCKTTPWSASFLGVAKLPWHYTLEMFFFGWCWVILFRGGLCNIFYFKVVLQNAPHGYFVYWIYKTALAVCMGLFCETSEVGVLFGMFHKTPQGISFWGGFRKCHRLGFVFYKTPMVVSFWEGFMNIPLGCFGTNICGSLNTDILL